MCHLRGLRGERGIDRPRCSAGAAGATAAPSWMGLVGDGGAGTRGGSFPSEVSPPAQLLQGRRLLSHLGVRELLPPAVCLSVWLCCLFGSLPPCPPSCVARKQPSSAGRHTDRHPTPSRVPAHRARLPVPSLPPPRRIPLSPGTHHFLIFLLFFNIKI